MPLRTIGSEVMDLRKAMSFQVSEGSKRDAAYSFSPDCFLAELIPDDLKSRPSKLAILQCKSIITIAE